MRSLLQDLIQKQHGFVELRYHQHQSNSLLAQKGRMDQASTQSQAGVGVRVLDSGSWGFSSTSVLTEISIQKAIDNARNAAQQLSKLRNDHIELAPAKLSNSSITLTGYEELLNMDLEQKIQRVLHDERQLNAAHQSIHTAAVRYSEIFEHKIIITSDGADAERKLVRPEFRTLAFAGSGSDQVSGGRSLGITGGWEDIFRHPSADNIIEATALETVDMLKARHVDAGTKTVILSPSLVGLLCHEAIGHTVEADFVQSGSVAKGKIGKRVGSELVNLWDGGQPHLGNAPGGQLPFDDEGVVCSSTPIIQNGLLQHYLHDRDSAKRFDDEARGNARAWSYSDEPLIRMTNTYLEPGESRLEDMIEGVEDGLLLTGAGGGQADATGEFMFGCQGAQEIKNGKLGKNFREVTLSGLAFDVLHSIDALSKDFLWDLGSGYCGKGQAAKVDAGGPHARCTLRVGGRNS
jgi:TldD protein